MPSDDSTARPLTPTQWAIVAVAAIGFAFDIYELLMLPLIARPALAELLGVDPATTSGNAAILTWTGYMMWGSALSGGTFGLLGGYMTDRFGRRRVLVWSILLYAGSAFAAAFSTSAAMLLVLRCTTFIGVCVEFVAAVAWLAELFPNPRQREAVLGYTQAFSSFGGLMVAGAYWVAVTYADYFPAIHGGHSPWRYTLISGLIPAIPLIIIRPFLPESPAWQRKRALGELRRPSVAELFAPAFRRTTIVTTIMFACAYGAAFGAIQLTPQMVPGLVPELKDIPPLQKKIEAAKSRGEETGALRAEIRKLVTRREQVVSQVQTWQEIGGLVGRLLLAYLAVRIVSRRLLLRMFQWPGLMIIPLVFLYAATRNLELLKWGIFAAGLFTVAQFSFWGNYLPRVYPTYLRGTGEGFAANVGGRMIGTLGAVATTQLQAFMPGNSPPTQLAHAAAVVALGVYLAGSILSFVLPEPQHEELPQ